MVNHQCKLNLQVPAWCHETQSKAWLHRCSLNSSCKTGGCGIIAGCMDMVPWICRDLSSFWSCNYEPVGVFFFKIRQRVFFLHFDLKGVFWRCGSMCHDMLPYFFFVPTGEEPEIPRHHLHMKNPAWLPLIGGLIFFGRPRFR